MAGLVIAQTHRVVMDTWSWQESLPLHLCDIAVFVVAAVLLGVGWRNPPARVCQRLYELAYVWAIAGTTQAVLTPDLAEGFPHPVCISYFALHGGIIVGVLIMTIGLRVRPQPGAVWRVWWTTLLLSLVVMFINWALDANYMYLCGPPEHPSLFDLFGRWPWSLLPLAAMATVLIVLCYAPFWLLDRLRRRPCATATPSESARCDT